MGTLRGLNRFTRDVAELRIQGASAVARATLDMAIHACGLVRPNSQKQWQNLNKSLSALARVRPTEPLARNIIRWYFFELQQASAKEVQGWLQLCEGVAQHIYYQMESAEASLVSSGKKLVKNRHVVFTHCHSTLAESILIAAHKDKKNFSVFHTETRPKFQGRTTALHLAHAGVQATMVADSAASWLVSNHSGDDVDIDLVILGADSIDRNGSAINKVGSFGIALSAYDSNIPVYIAATLLKCDWHRESIIEIRSAGELWSQAPQGVRIINYAFDSIPPYMITGFITEFGVIKPRQIMAAAKKKYPWMTLR